MSHTEDPTESRKKILAIDDEPDLLSFLQLVLEKGGYQPVTAPNGTEGLIRAHVEQPELILLDIMMEEMDGWETLRQLKAQESTRDIPVIVVSARNEPNSRERALADGAVDFISKPFPVKESLEKIASIVSS